MKSIWVCLIFIVSACSLTPKAEDLLQHMVVQTTYDENTAFSFYSSFTLSPDTLGFASNYDPDTLLLGSYATSVTNAIQNNMQDAGYTFLNKNQNPDLGF